MATPGTDPLDLLVQTYDDLKAEGTAMPLPDANTYFTEWMAQMASETDPLVVAVRTGIESLSAALNNGQGDVKPKLRALGEATMKYADSLPDDEDGGGSPGGGTAERPRKKRHISDLAITLMYMSL